MNRFGSLFSGIGGLDMAVEACGWAPAWQVESDEFCTKVLERHWPDVRRYGDIRQVDWRSVEPVDLVCGGFPCQPFSVAGQNRGEDDERNMWPETYRAVRELRPRYVFLENVSGLLAHGYFGRILGDLAEGGYDAVWDTFTAAEVGAPHRRERLFILAYANDVGHPEGDAGARWPEPAGRAGEALPGRSGATVADTYAARLERRRDGRGKRADERAARTGSPPLADAAGSRQRASLRDDDEGKPDSLGRFPPGPDDRAAWARVLAGVPALEPAVCRVATGVPDRTHRLRALGNAVVPAQGAYALRALWERMNE